MKAQYKVNRVVFLGKWVAYMTIIGDDNFMSCHNRTGLSDEQAKEYFRREHDNEVNILRKQKMQRATN